MERKGEQMNENVFDMYVQTIDEHGSALVGSVTRFSDMVVDAMEIWQSAKKPVFLRVSSDSGEQLFPLISDEGKVLINRAARVKHASKSGTRPR
jgi:tryptophan synthase beta subunit